MKRARTAATGLLLTLLALAWSPTLRADDAAAAADDPCATTPTADCVVAHAVALIEADDGAAAVAYLKAHRTDAGADERFPRALARAYLARGNRVWARRTLTQRLSAAPDDCEARLLLAWVGYQDGDPAAATDTLAEGGCPAEGPHAGRRALMAAAFADAQGDGVGARAALADARAQDALYEEDVEFLTYIGRKAEPEREPPFQLTAELKAGWTSNPQAGSPLDPQKSGDDAASPLMDAKVWARGGYAVTPYLSPFLEGTVRMMAFTAPAADQLGFFQPSVRPGIAWSLGRGVVLSTAYRWESTLSFGGDDNSGNDPAWYSEGHRGELGLALGGYLNVTAGAGRRTYRPMARTRTEVDLRVGGGGAVVPGLFLQGAVSGRMHRAEHEAYNLFGATALGSLQVALGAGVSLRGQVSVAWDHYPDSRGYPDFQPDVDSDDDDDDESMATATSNIIRTDWKVSGALGVWSPRWFGGLQVGAFYEPSRRFTDSDSYAYTDHRVFLHVRWSFSADPTVPDGLARGRRVPVDWGIDPNELQGERIQDLMRQDEDAQRGSSCMN